MKRAIVLLLALVAVSSFAESQFKQPAESRPTVSGSLVRTDDTGLLFGWFDPGRFIMRHSYSFSYSNIGGRGISMGIYTNSLYYKLSEPLDVQFDISLMHSPFNSFGKRNDLSGLYLSRAQLNYRPSEDVLFQIQFRQLPSLYWLWNSNRYSSFFGGVGQFDGEER